MKYSFSLLCIILPAVAFSQVTWRNGVIKLRDGTVLEGQINDQEWDQSPKKIEFRKSDQTVQNYSANEINSFVTDRPVRFESHYVTYDADRQELKDLPQPRESANVVKGRLLLEVKVNASIGLLYMKDSYNRNHFFLKQDTTVAELLHRFFQNPQNNLSMFTNERFKQQLTVITSDCPKIQNKMKTAQYNLTWLSNIVKEINACKGNEIVLPSDVEVKTAARKRPTYGIAIQAQKNGVSYKNYFKGSLNDINFGAGVFVELYSKKKPNKISLYNELLYKKLTGQEGVERGLFGVVRTDFECVKIKLVNALRVSFPGSSGGRFYTGIGLINGLRMDTKIVSKAIRSNPDDDFSKGFETGFTAMAGKTFALGVIRLTGEVRYEYEAEIGGEFFVFNNLGLNVQVGF